MRWGATQKELETEKRERTWQVVEVLLEADYKIRDVSEEMEELKREVRQRPIQNHFGLLLCSRDFYNFLAFLPAKD